MIKLVAVICAACALLLLGAGPSEAVWPMYHEPSFDGKVIDIATGKPIEGAVVVAVYNKRALGARKGQSSSVINVKEVLTDREGRFHIPSYTTVLALPFTQSDRTTFLIYKPGYASVTLPLKSLFTGRTKSEKELSPWDDPVLSGKYKIRLFPSGAVGLPKLETKDERLRNMPSLPDKLDHLGRQKTLTRLINEEKRELGEPEIDPYQMRNILLNEVKREK
ncbi:MAG: carboxypeptidase regulatory-like domain-containing protein [Geobacter sp.]|nr:MAG: carboxypeptidase regulatory-like domain-containing protein [Geobacter sp.]